MPCSNRAVPRCHVQVGTTMPRRNSVFIDGPNSMWIVRVLTLDWPAAMNKKLGPFVCSSLTRPEQGFEARCMNKSPIPQSNWLLFPRTKWLV
ncbi:unnamed protein product [Linum trigynum]|uniref:Uncharacterized protein n=1 Tax=Linum trigynum TaxID=586398 RepID=A0AAV2DLQ5_9ROSI